MGSKSKRIVIGVVLVLLLLVLVLNTNSVFREFFELSPFVGEQRDSSQIDSNDAYRLERLNCKYSGGVWKGSTCKCNGQNLNPDSQRCINGEIRNRGEDPVPSEIWCSDSPICSPGCNGLVGAPCATQRGEIGACLWAYTDEGNLYSCSDKNYACACQPYEGPCCFPAEEGLCLDGYNGWDCPKDGGIFNEGTTCKQTDCPIE
jgi:hypothetical protein